MTGFDYLNLKLPLILAILIFMSIFNFMLSSVEHENVLLPRDQVPKDLVEDTPHTELNLVPKEFVCFI